MMFAALAAFAAAQERTPLADLSTLRWQNRLLIVHEPASVDALLALFASNAPAIVERSVIWFIVSGDRVHSNYPAELAGDLADIIRRSLDTKENSALLIGLDGGIKMRSEGFDLQRFFSAIDAMPMRIWERRSREVLPAQP